VIIKKIAGAVAATAIAFSIGAATVAPASAAENIKPFGHPETLLDPATGAPVVTYTVDGLRPSSDPVPHNGQLYEATVTVVVRGAMPMFHQWAARAESSAFYPAIGGGVPGKLYFDVVGDVPNSVVYNDGVRDLLVWIPGAPQGGTRP
jgi:hypothetical protein